MNWFQIARLANITLNKPSHSLHLTPTGMGVAGELSYYKYSSGELL